MAVFLSWNSRGENAEALVADVFKTHGWDIERPSEKQSFDLLISQKKQRFVVELKSLAEGRADRVIPILSQAILQAQAYARNVKDAEPLAIVSVGNASHSLLKNFEAFVDRYVPNVAVGLVSDNGLRYFRGAGLEALNADLEEPRRYEAGPYHQPANLFSDLNQWMLKVLLASELPDKLLNAPKEKYRTGSELAEAANVSAMSASRFLQQLRNEGYLSESSRYITLVRRSELFRRWCSALMRYSPELPMRFLIRGAIQKQLPQILASHKGESCLGLFQAADALGFGHVSGVPPYIYVPKLPQPGDKKWKMLVAASSDEKPDLIVRQALSPKSVFRGAVDQAGVAASDIIQVWLDVSNHPARGNEQADFIYKKALLPIIQSET